MGTELSSESDAGKSVLVGKCGCGTVRYRVADAFLYAANCHCSRCRAATGSAFKPFAGIEREKLEVTDGGDALLVFGEEDLNDTRCAACGSLLFSVVRDGAYVHVAMGSLVDAPTIRPAGHVFQLSPIYEDENAVAFEFENMIVNLLETPAAHDLITPAAVGGREAGSRFQLTIWVDDADAVCAELATRGVELLNGPMNREWGMRTASFTDPDGHIWEVARSFPRPRARSGIQQEAWTDRWPS